MIYMAIHISIMIDISKTNFLTVAEVSALLRLSELTIYKYLKEGKLEAVEFGGHYRISESSLFKFIEKHKVNSVKEENE